MPEMAEYVFNEAGQLTELEHERKRPHAEISIVHVEGNLFFGAAELFQEQMRRVCEDRNLKVVILKMRNAYHLDATSVMALEELVNSMRENHRTLLVSEARKDVLRIFKKSGLRELIGRDHIFPDNLQNPTLSTAQALRKAQSLVGPQEARISILVDTKEGLQ
ncbi:MAG TPA: sodium-independent anion transporter, partial [Opitutales bacterium]|nr:sodium-independent anion transporter [Opitutales bacterium]